MVELHRLYLRCWCGFCAVVLLPNAGKRRSQKGSAATVAAAAAATVSACCGILMCVFILLFECTCDASIFCMALARLPPRLSLLSPESCDVAVEEEGAVGVAKVRKAAEEPPTNRCCDRGLGGGRVGLVLLLMLAHHLLAGTVPKRVTFE